MKKGRAGDDILTALYPAEPIGVVLEGLRLSTGREWTHKEAYNRAHVLHILRQVRERQLPPSLGTLRQPITINDDKMLLCSDSQIPYHDRQLWAQVCKVGRERKITTLVHVGDFVDCEGFAKFDPLVVPVAWEDEERIGSELLVEISEAFSRIILIMGNHEYRMVKALKGQLPFSKIMRGWEFYDIIGASAKVDVEDLPVAYLGDWGMVCHPAAYSQTSGAVAVRLAEKEHRDIYMGHDHYMALRFDRSGKYKAVSLGCMCREELMPYKQFSVTTHPHWNKGFVTIEDRKPTLHLP